MSNEIIKAEKDIRKLVENYVKTGPFELNPDSKKVDKVIKGLATRKVKYGHQYCPCRMMSGNKEIDAKIICPCEYHTEEIKQDGICSCDLFVSQDYKSVASQVR